LGGSSDAKGEQAVVWRFLRLKGEQELEWPIRTKNVVRLAGKKDAYLLQAYLIKIGASRNERQ
jgi:hypothetical protein